MARADSRDIPHAAASCNYLINRDPFRSAAGTYEIHYPCPDILLLRQFTFDLPGRY